MKKRGRLQLPLFFIYFARQTIVFDLSDPLGGVAFMPKPQPERTPARRNQC